MLIIRPDGTVALGSSARGIENRLVLQDIDGTRQIIAVGGASDWGLSGPLPADAIQVDLVQASVQDPSLAPLLWGRFLAYVDAKENRGFMHALKKHFLGIPVALEISDERLRQAVATALRGSERYGIRLQKGSSRR
jgi:hypothetical protein